MLSHMHSWLCANGQGTEQLIIQKGCLKIALVHFLTCDPQSSHSDLYLLFWPKSSTMTGNWRYCTFKNTWNYPIRNHEKNNLRGIFFLSDLWQCKSSVCISEILSPWQDLVCSPISFAYNTVAVHMHNHYWRNYTVTLQHASISLTLKSRFLKNTMSMLLAC